MTTLHLAMTPWQQDVFLSPERFKVVAAGRRCGKTHLAAIRLIQAALDGRPGKVFYVAPTQGMARDIMWDKLFELAGDAIVDQNVNNLTITLAGGNKIYLKGADRPDTLRGVSLKFLVLDEMAFMKADVWTTILRPCTTELKADVLFIGTPEGRNHFYDLYINGQVDDPKFKQWKSWSFTSRDNPFLDPLEIKEAEETLPGWAFRQEYLASFDAKGSEYFDVETFEYYDELPEGLAGNYYIAADLAGFETERGGKTKRRDNTAIAVVFVDTEGCWWVQELVYGRWTLQETTQRFFSLVEEYRPVSTGIEKGIAQQAAMNYMQDLMRETLRVFHIQLLSHGNQKKQDRILWALQGRLEHNKVKFKKAEWNMKVVDEASAFPSQLVTDDLLDALSYIDQLAVVSYNFDDDYDTWEPYDKVAGY